MKQVGIMRQAKRRTTWRHVRTGLIGSSIKPYMRFLVFKTSVELGYCKGNPVVKGCRDLHTLLASHFVSAWRHWQPSCYSKAKLCGRCLPRPGPARSARCENCGSWHE